MKPLYIKPVKHSHTRRALWNDYRERGIYMVTITAEKGAPSFGYLDGGMEHPFIRLTEAGMILEKEIKETTVRRPSIKILAHKVMPDHAHIIFFITKPMQDHLGNVVRGIKGAASSKIKNIFPEFKSSIFTKNYNDRKVSRRQQLDILIKYVADNPRRLAIIKKFPDLFHRYNHIRIGNREFAAYGNIFLLRDFDRQAVMVHRGYTAYELAALENRWLHTAANGGVLVSPFISPAEKAVRDKALQLGGRLIILRSEGFQHRFKPSGKEFELCEKGRLLLLAPWPYDNAQSSALSRSKALRLNAMAEEIAALESTAFNLCAELSEN